MSEHTRELFKAMGRQSVVQRQLEPMLREGLKLTGHYLLDSASREAFGTMSPSIVVAATFVSSNAWQLLTDEERDQLRNIGTRLQGQVRIQQERPLPLRQMVRHCLRSQGLL